MSCCKDQTPIITGNPDVVETTVFPPEDVVVGPAWPSDPQPKVLEASNPTIQLTLEVPANLPADIQAVLFMNDIQDWFMDARKTEIMAKCDNDADCCSDPDYCFSGIAYDFSRIMEYMASR